MPTRAVLEPWKSFLTELDASIDEELELHCLGGFAMTFLYGLERPTADVDILPIASSAAERLISIAGQGSTLHRKHRVYIQIVGVAPVPINYEDRLKEMFPGTFSRMGLWGLDPYDVALSKLERNTQRDRDDVKHLARTVPLDVKVLEERYLTELRTDLGILSEKI
jgi:hypothetical protein